MHLQCSSLLRCVSGSQLTRICERRCYPLLTLLLGLLYPALPICHSLLDL